MDYDFLFKALSNKARIRTLRLLSEAKKELCICELMTALNLSQDNVSKHVRELRIAGLVKEKRDGRFVFYSVIPPDSSAKKYVMKAVCSLDKSLFREDDMRLKKRLSLRKRGKPVLCIGRCR